MPGNRSSTQPKIRLHRVCWIEWIAVIEMLEIGAAAGQLHVLALVLFGNHLQRHRHFSSCAAAQNGS